jgi:hypothetical protein
VPWGVFTQLQSGDGSGTEAKAYWTRPIAPELLPIPVADFLEMPLPSSVVGMKHRISWAKYEGRDYGVGGWTDNLIWTEHMELVRQGIEAPNVVPNVSLVAGPGVTGEIICYLAYFDEKTGERSSLSAPSATLTASNQQVAWASFPAPLDNRPTHIELWRSVDGTLPRLVMRRQLGVVSVTEGVSELGEAFIEEFRRFPRCRFNVIYHERQFMAGDDEHPDTLYLSALNAPERWAGLTLRTRNGERIIGLMVVRDRLVVICPFSRYSVFGYTEDDLEMQISEPQIGGLNHWSVAMVHGNAWIWTQLGLYLSDAASSFYLTNDIEAKFTEQYRGHRDAYEDAWAVHDPVRHVIKLYVGNHDDVVDGQAYWVANYDEVVSQVGGQLGQPRWSYDKRGRTDHCAGLLALREAAGRSSTSARATDSRAWKTGRTTTTTATRWGRGRSSGTAPTSCSTSVATSPAARDSAPSSTCSWSQSCRDGPSTFILVTSSLTQHQKRAFRFLRTCSRASWAISRLGISTSRKARTRSSCAAA